MFLLNEDAVALVGFLSSLSLDISSTLLSDPSFFAADLLSFLVNNRKDIQRLIWKWGAENILRPDGCNVAAFMLEHSLETTPSDLHCPQTHWITQKIMQSNGFQRVLYVLERNIKRDPMRYASSGSFGINFQASNDRDLYLSIGNCSLKYTCKKTLSSVRIDFSIEDIYDFSEIRTFGTDENGIFFKKNFKEEIGSWANDAGLFSQGDGVIHNYKTFITFSKTIPLIGAFL